MRAGVSSRGRWWVSLGPLGWIVLLPFLAAYLAVWLLVALVSWIAALTRAARSPRP
jgi:hypothetical protein